MVKLSTVGGRANLYSARFPSNLRPTTRECVHLLPRGHFRSCDKDGGHTTQSAISYRVLEATVAYATLICTFYYYSKTPCYIQTSWL